MAPSVGSRWDGGLAQWNAERGTSTEHDLVAEEWQTHLGELRERAGRLPELERAGLDEQIAFMEETDMAVVVSQSQNEIADMREAGLDIAPHRRRMLEEKSGRALQGSGPIGFGWSSSARCG